MVRSSPASMTNLKRTAESLPQTRSKKSKSLTKTEIQELASETVDSTPQIEEASTQDDEDAGSLTEVARRVQKLTAQGNGKDPWPREFSKKLKDDQTEVLQNLANAKQKIIDERAAFEDELLSLVAMGLAPLNTQNRETTPSRPLDVPHIAAEDQDLFQQSVRVMKEIHFLLDEYHRLSNRYQEPSGLSELKKGFAESQAATASAIRAGRIVAQADIENLLADKHHEVRQHRGFDGEVLKFGRALLISGDKEESEAEDVMGWGAVAYKTHKVVEKMQDIVRGED